MRVYLEYMLAAAALCASIQVNSVKMSSNPCTNTVAHPLPVGKDVMSTVRYLRTTEDERQSTTTTKNDDEAEKDPVVHAAVNDLEGSSAVHANDDDEERGFVSELKSLAGRFKLWLKTLLYGELAEPKNFETFDFEGHSLRETVEKLFEDPYFKTELKKWTYRSKTDVAVTNLVDDYPGVLYTILEGGAKKYPSTRDLATKLQRLQREDWLTRNVNPNTIIKSFTLDRKLDSISFVNAWIQYVEDFNKKNHLDAKKSAIDMLVDKYEVEADFKIVFKAAQNRLGKYELEATWNEQQLVSWMRLGRHPKEVFLLKGLDRGFIKIRKRSRIKEWLKYVKAFNERYPEKKMYAIDVLVATYTKDTEFKKLFNVAKYSYHIYGLAPTWKQQQILSWMRLHRQPDEVFAWMGLNRKSSTMLYQPKYKAWLEYFEVFNIRYPDDKVNVIDVLTKTYKDAAELKRISKATEKMLDAIRGETGLQQVEAKWSLDVGLVPDEFFKYLKLDHKLDSIHSNPNVKLWVKYADRYVEKYVKDWWLFDPYLLGPETNNRAICATLGAAMKNPEEKDLAVKLMENLAKSWRNLRYRPGEVFAFMGLDGNLNGLLSSPHLQMFEDYVTKFNANHDSDADVEMIDVLLIYYNKPALRNLFKESGSGNETPTVANLKKQMEDRPGAAALNRNAIKVMGLQDRPPKSFLDSRLQILLNHIKSTLKEGQFFEQVAISVLRSIQGKLLADFLKEAMKSPESSADASALYNELLKQWKEELKLEPRDVREYLGVPTDDPDRLYLDEYEAEYARKRRTHD